MWQYIYHKSTSTYQKAKKTSTLSSDYETAKLLLGKQIAEFYTIFSISAELGKNPEQMKVDLSKLIFSKSSNYLITFLKAEASKRISILGVGKSSPNFFLEDSRDSLVSLSQFKRQVVYLSFWFAGCKGCIQEFPFENEMVKKFTGKPLKIISICTRTSKEKWLEKINSFGLETLNLYANPSWSGTLEKKFGIEVYPHYVLIGKDGNVIENFANRPSQRADLKIEKELSVKNLD
ncbi:TlpA disulfide reductase family protein [Dyadobacter sp. 3J3]|uniref:TlpA family protein disulfide reductase n=1 Tax=Dyadobacter sp. 3J3 TaxID=2606600 RepID=UPI001359C6B9|nr:TlpA disulfide reductase family protein [Dyadobacter sp. 3J3]